MSEFNEYEMDEDVTESTDYDEGSDDNFEEELDESMIYEVSESTEEEMDENVEEELDESIIYEVNESTEEEMDENVEEELDESQLTPAELKELADKETAEKIQEAEDDADAQGLTTWSDGTPRGGVYRDEDSEVSEEDHTAENEERERLNREEQERIEKEEQETTEKEEQENEEMSEVEKEIKDLEAEKDRLLKEYKDLETLRSRIAEGTENANDIDTAYRFAEDQRNVGEEMDAKKTKITEIIGRVDTLKGKQRK